ncbi:hypothetical protein PQQ88_27365 [Paraburkholderia caledonica]|uniref:hypothetical protein n=1 Tax=Paraburkholderia caledonica TaxID=134536 RepID=UPI0038BBAFD4
MALSKGEIDYPVKFSEAKDSLAFKLVEKRIGAVGLLEYRFYEDLQNLGCISFPPPAPANSEKLGTTGFALGMHVAIFGTPDGSYELVNSLHERRIRLTKEGFSTLSKYLASNYQPQSGAGDLLSFLMKFGFLRIRETAGYANASDIFSSYESLFHYLCFDSPVLLAPNKISRPVRTVSSEHGHKIDSDLLEAMRRRRSRRAEGIRQITLGELQAFFYILLEEHGSNEVISRNFPAAGGFYNIAFFCAVNECGELHRGIYEATLPASGGNVNFRNLHRCESDLDYVLSEASLAWGVEEEVPDVLVFISIDNRKAVNKYREKAYRLALLNGGVLMHVMYMLAEAIGLAGCGIGAASHTLENIVKAQYPQQKILVEFALGTRGE